MATEPIRAYGESAAYDLSACLISEESGRRTTKTIAPRTSLLIGTKLALRPPTGHCILICSRSGLATRSVFVGNAPGVVDPNYTGEIKIILYNGGLEPHYVQHADRIAQALIIPFAACALRKVTTLPSTERGDKGFGSSGS